MLAIWCQSRTTKCLLNTNIFSKTVKYYSFHDLSKSRLGISQTLAPFTVLTRKQPDLRQGFASVHTYKKKLGVTDLTSGGSKQKDYIEVYEMPAARLLRLHNLMAKVSTILFSCALPTLFASVQSGAMSQDVAIQFGSELGVISLLFLANSFLISSRMLAHIMVSTDDKFVVLSHFSFLGKKESIVASPEDLVPIKSKLNKVFNVVTVKKDNFSKKFLLVPKLGNSELEIESLEALFHCEPSQDKESVQKQK